MDPGEEHDLAGDPAGAEQLARWREIMVRELEARDCGLVAGGMLRTLGLEEAIHSPHLYHYGCKGGDAQVD